ncbi:MAG: flavodoxin family protein [Bacillota bacterium]
MKILAIVGSPRKGESYKLIQEIEKRLKRYEDVCFEILMLRDYDIKSCTGCHLCINKEGPVCPLKDDTYLIESKMKESDGIILVSPLYSQHVTALMKSFIDHLSYLWHRPRYFGRKAMVIATGGASFKTTLKFMAAAAKAWGFHAVSRLGVPHLDALTPKFRQKIEKKIDKEIESFYMSIKEKKLPAPGIGDLMWFEMWKVNAIVCKESLPADFPFWKERGWIDGSYYYNTQVNVWKWVIVKLLGWLGKNYMRKVYKGYDVL